MYFKDKIFGFIKFHEKKSPISKCSLIWLPPFSSFFFIRKKYFKSSLCYNFWLFSVPCTLQLHWLYSCLSSTNNSTPDNPKKKFWSPNIISNILFSPHLDSPLSPWMSLTLLGFNSQISCCFISTHVVTSF